MICPKHAFEHKPSDYCPNAMTEVWWSRHGFDSIAKATWTAPRIQIERGAGARRLKAGFGVGKVGCGGSGDSQERPRARFRAVPATLPVRTAKRPCRAQIAHCGTGCEK